MTYHDFIINVHHNLNIKKFWVINSTIYAKHHM